MTAAEVELQQAQAKRMEQLLARHRIEVLQLREEIEDPQEALFTFVRDTFDFLSFFPDVRQNSITSEWDDDDLDGW